MMDLECFLPGFAYFMSLRALDSVDEVACPSMLVTEILPALITPVGFVDRDLVPTRHTLNFLGHGLSPVNNDFS